MGEGVRGGREPADWRLQNGDCRLGSRATPGPRSGDGYSRATSMDRREAIRYLGAVAVAPLLAPLSPAEQWAVGTTLHRRLAEGVQAGRALSAAQIAELRALAETIIPRTDTPGAVDVGAVEFVDLLLAEWYPDQERTQLVAGLDGLTSRCRAMQGKAMAELGPEVRVAFVATVDGAQGERGTPEWAYARLKDALIFAFLTSEPIARLTSQMPVIPGRFDGCVPV